MNKNKLNIISRLMGIKEKRILTERFYLDIPYFRIEKRKHIYNCFTSGYCAICVRADMMNKEDFDSLGLNEDVENEHIKANVYNKNQNFIFKGICSDGKEIKVNMKELKERVSEYKRSHEKGHELTYIINNEVGVNPLFLYWCLKLFDTDTIYVRSKLKPIGIKNKEGNMFGILMPKYFKGSK